MLPIITETVSNAPKTASYSDAWWLEKHPHNTIHPLVDRLNQDQSSRYNEFLKYLRLYGNKELKGFAANIYTKTNNSHSTTNRLTLNIIKSCVDTASSKIGKMRPKPQFLTSNGNWEQQQRAKKLTKYVEGVFEENDLYETSARVFVDAAVFGTGVLKIYTDGKKVKLERVLPTEIVICDEEAVYGKPRSMFQTKFVHRSVLINMFPKFKSQIAEARGGIENDMHKGVDMVQIIEAYHLPSGPGAKDGLRTISIPNCTLYSEEWDKDFFPFVKFCWTENIMGWFGIGLAEELVGIQVEINRVLQTIQKAQSLVAIPRIFVENASKVVSAHITNEIGSIIRYSGAPPTFFTGQGLSSEVYQHLENLYRKAYEITGISLLSATSAKPTGLNSGVALREYQDVETERFMLTAQRFERLFLTVARIIVILSKELYLDNPNLAVKSKGKNFLETIKWADVDLDEDKFIQKLYPVSLLPGTPQGRLDKVSEMFQAGLLSKEDGLALLDFPDLEKVNNLYLSGRDNILMILNDMLENGKYTQPEPYTNLELALRMAQEQYLRSKVEGAPEERLELVRNFIDDVLELLQPPADEAGGPVPGAVDPGMLEADPLTGEPLAKPQSAPTSDLMPIA